MLDKQKIDSLITSAVGYKERAERFEKEMKWILEMDGVYLPEQGCFEIPKAHKNCASLFWRVPVPDKGYYVWKECIGCSSAIEDLELIRRAYLPSEAKLIAPIPEQRLQTMNKEAEEYEPPSQGDMVRDYKVAREMRVSLDDWLEVLMWTASGEAEKLYAVGHWYEIQTSDNMLIARAYTQHKEDSKPLFKKDASNSLGATLLEMIEDPQEYWRINKGRRLGATV